MEQTRTAFQGVGNIIRFNWHFYVIALIAIIILIILGIIFNFLFFPSLFISVSIIMTTIISLFVSYYIYDISDLYQLNFLNNNHLKKNDLILNINAGFDETSETIASKFKQQKLIALDFYDPKKHTEVSIKRARKAYPPYSNTQEITTDSISLENESASIICNILSAHEIRGEAERAIFFRELNRILKDDGIIYVTEHLRDTPNFIAYNIGFLHFHSNATWERTFQQANFIIKNKIKTTPFITTYILIKNGNTN